ncbi:MAG: hypothetical protein ACR2IO_02495 [Candidatus Nanopelagicus sp.]|jgi:hypothetical protein
MKKLRIAVLVFTFLLGLVYQPNWIYQNFYFNPRWVNDAWWSLSYPAYLVIYSLLSTAFVELVIRFIKKYT